jgi:hypothetical protein
MWQCEDAKSGMKVPIWEGMAVRWANVGASPLGQVEVIELRRLGLYVGVRWPDGQILWFAPEQFLRQLEPAAEDWGWLI